MAKDTRSRILSALRTVLAGGGSAAATLEAVAAAAGVSKGGLLYHFPTKQALYAGLVDQTRESVQRELAALGSPAEVVRRYLEYVAPRDEDERGFVIALINALQEAVIADPSPDPAATPDPAETSPDAAELSGLFNEIFSAWEQPVRAAISDPVTAEIVLQVGNGWYLSSIAGLRHPDPDLLRSTIDTLVALAVGSRS